MAAVHGKGGTVTFTGAELTTIESWSFDASSDSARTTGMGNSFESYAPGLDTFSGSAEVLAATAADIVADVGTEQTLTLQIETGKTIAANAILTSITETASIDDVGKLSIQFVGDADTVTYPA
jgi:hypothetical protein